MKWLWLLVLLVSCHQDALIPNTCGVSNPLADLPWLKQLNQDNTLISSIVQGTYQGKTVYAVYACARCFAGPSVGLYGCDGSKICSGLVLDTTPTNCNQVALNLQNKITLIERAP